MCGRFRLATNADTLEEHFAFRIRDISKLGGPLVPRYNIAPAQPVLVVVNDGERRGDLMHWGLIPPWAKDATIGNRLINARAETVAEKPSFRHALRKKRCLVLADGFYEWKRADGRKMPYHIALKSAEPFALAGLWSEWREPLGDVVRSCAIITTTPNALMATIHDRMPVILPRGAESAWLEARLDDPAVLTGFLSPYPAEEMEAYPVSPLVNNPRNDSPACIARVPGVMRT